MFWRDIVYIELLCWGIQYLDILFYSNKVLAMCSFVGI